MFLNFSTSKSGGDFYIMEQRRRDEPHVRVGRYHRDAGSAIHEAARRAKPGVDVCVLHKGRVIWQPGF